MTKLIFVIDILQDTTDELKGFANTIDSLHQQAANLGDEVINNILYTVYLK